MDLRYHYYIAAKPEHVWQTLISDEGVKHTFYGCTIRSSFRIGEDLAYVGPGAEGQETVHVCGKVLAFEPNRTFSYTEHPGPSYHPNHNELETRVTFTLEPVGQCTKLTLVNDQWPDHHPSYNNTASHWPMILSNIKTYAETGRTLDLGF